MEAEAEITLKLSGGLSKLLEKALKPEVETPATPRAKAYIEALGEEFRIVVEAQDTAALRAAVNSYLRWVEGCLSALQGLRQL